MRQSKTHIGIALVAAVLSALTAEAYTFKVKVDPRDPPEKEEVSLWTVREERRPAMDGEGGVISIGPNTVQSVTIPVVK